MNTENNRQPLRLDWIIEESPFGRMTCINDTVYYYKNRRKVQTNLNTGITKKGWDD